jgi:hypothetical protein
MRLLVLSTYYFMKEGGGTGYDLKTTRAFKIVLLSICEDFVRSREGLPPSPHVECSMVVKLRVRVPPHMLKTAEKHKSETDKIIPQDSANLEDSSKTSSMQTRESLVKPIMCLAIEGKDPKVCVCLSKVRTKTDLHGTENTRSLRRVLITHRSLSSP